MNFEKVYNSPIYVIFEFLYRLIIINLLFVLTTILGLGVFTVMPAMVSLLILVRSLNHETSFPIVSAFVQAFRKNYKRVFMLSIFYGIIAIVFVFNTLYFYLFLQETNSFIHQILFYIMLILDAVVFVASVNACFVYVYFPNLSNKKIIKYSFVLLRAIPIQSVVIFGMILGMIFVAYVMPILIVLILVSLFAYIIQLAIDKTYRRLVADGVKSLDAFDYMK